MAGFSFADHLTLVSPSLGVIIERYMQDAFGCTDVACLQDDQANEIVQAIVDQCVEGLAGRGDCLGPDASTP